MVRASVLLREISVTQAGLRPLLETPAAMQGYVCQHFLTKWYQSHSTVQFTSHHSYQVNQCMKMRQVSLCFFQCLTVNNLGMFCFSSFLRCAFQHNFCNHHLCKQKQTICMVIESDAKCSVLPGHIRYRKLREGCATPSAPEQWKCVIEHMGKNLIHPLAYFGMFFIGFFNTLFSSLIFLLFPVQMFHLKMD